MNKVIAVSALAMAGMFSTQALADESKTGFYVTGKAGASVMSLADQRFLSGDGEETSKYKGGDGHDTVFSGGIAAGYDFYPQFSIPVRTELEFYARGKADSKYNVDKDSWSGGYWRDDLKNEVSVNTLMLNAYYDFGMTVHSHHGYLQGLATPEFTRKQPVSVPGIMGTEAVVANRCHVQALLTTSHGALARVSAMT